jgi:2-hydroxy fatty acid dioxygenase
MLPSFDQFFVSYGSYHDNIVNKIIHIICIPQILFSLYAMLLHTMDQRFIYGIQYDYFLIFLTGLMLVYLKIDVISGLVSTLFYFGISLYCRHLFLTWGADNLDQHFRIFLIQHIVGWAAQFIGHGVFEKRKPALMDNLLLTMVAPDFVIIEIMFYLGYKKDIQDKCQKDIDANIKAFRASLGKKSE